MKKVFLILAFFIITEELYSQPIRITVPNDLKFDDVIQTESKDVPKTSTKAAKFRIISNIPRNVYIDFILPTHYVSGANTVPVTFDANHSGWNFANNPTTSTSFNPHQQLVVQTLVNNASIYIWLGGILTSSSATVPGDYTGDIVINVTIY